ncbi:3-oxoacyl-ACP reductase [Luedemannella helvata]|uniref:3-oxoacyl-ACP reductase n=1 Tax=Luedemannella helvata TaxID=349315 RepID=A0ABN2K4K2_9ACTN
MTDRYRSFANSGVGRGLVKRLGLPQPAPLRRYTPGDPLVTGPVLLAGAGRAAGPARAVLTAAAVEVLPERGTAPTLAAIVYDATDLATPADLADVHAALHPAVRSLIPSGRVIVFSSPSESAPAAVATQQALEGFVRSLGKELGRGSTAQLVRVAPGAEGNLASTLRFLLSGRSAYVSGQVIDVGTGSAPIPADWNRPLAGRVALVTGAAGGIGAATARVLARDGAHVVCLDVPAAGDELAAVANGVSGEATQLDLTAADAAERICDLFAARHDGLDIVVHNAGVTRDRTLGRMGDAEWSQVIAVNLTAPERITQALLDEKLVRSGGRIIGVSSIAGLAGNRGQTNYAASKAGVIGLVRGWAPVLADRGITVNAVAPGVIDTAMTARMPPMLREAARRMNSLAQAGLPVDVAETIAWLAAPATGGVTGNVVRVCGQSLLGA